MANPANCVNDGELLQALALLRDKPSLLNDWELDFAKGVTERYARCGMTWSQRATGKKIVGKVMERLATKHGREDLLTGPRRALADVVPPPQAPSPIVATPVAPAPREITAKDVAGLTDLHRRILEILSDVAWHRTANTTSEEAGTVRGSSAKMLERRGVVQRRGGYYEPCECRITAHGVAVLMYLRTVEATCTEAAAIDVPRGVWR